VVEGAGSLHCRIIAICAVQHIRAVCRDAAAAALLPRGRWCRRGSQQDMQTSRATHDYLEGQLRDLRCRPHQTASAAAATPAAASRATGRAAAKRATTRAAPAAGCRTPRRRPRTAAGAVCAAASAGAPRSLEATGKVCAGVCEHRPLAFPMCLVRLFRGGPKAWRRSCMVRGQATLVVPHAVTVADQLVKSAGVAGHQLDPLRTSVPHMSPRRQAPRGRRRARRPHAAQRRRRRRRGGVGFGARGRRGRAGRRAAPAAQAAPRAPRAQRRRARRCRRPSRWTAPRPLRCAPGAPVRAASHTCALARLRLLILSTLECLASVEMQLKGLSRGERAVQARAASRQGRPASGARGESPPTRRSPGVPGGGRASGRASTTPSRRSRTRVRRGRRPWV